MYSVGGDGLEPTNTAYTHAKCFLCVGACVRVCVCVRACVCMCLIAPAHVCGELNYIYLHVADTDYRLRDDNCS